MLAARPRRILGLLGALAILSLLLAAQAQANRDGYKAAEACDCHSEEPSPSVQINVDGWPTEFAPDTTYKLNVSASGGPEGTHGGFATEVTKGSFSSTDPVVKANDRNATHAKSSQRAWTIDWRAPPEDSGETRLVLYVNLANGDDEEDEEDLWNFVALRAPEKAPEPPKPSTIDLSFAGASGSSVAGENLTITATLRNFTGAPIAKAPVAFFQNTSYGSMPIGRTWTNADGTASVNVKPLAACECRFYVHYDGSSKNLSSSVLAAASVTDPNGVFGELYPTPPGHTFSSYSLVTSSIVAVVGGVWATLGYAALSAVRLRALAVGNVASASFTHKGRGN